MFDILASFDAAVIAAFMAACAVLIITPGVDFVFITASGISGGPRLGMAAALGVNLGVIIHVLTATAGISALFLAYPAAYDAIRLSGAAYLAWLAIKAWRDRSELGQGGGGRGVLATVRRAFVTNVLNPKTALFIFAFIPQFADPRIGPVWAQILILGAIFLIMALIFTLALGAFSGWLAAGLRAKSRILNRISAILFGGLAARLAIQ